MTEDQTVKGAFRPEVVEYVKACGGVPLTIKHVRAMWRRANDKVGKINTPALLVAAVQELIEEAQPSDVQD